MSAAATESRINSTTTSSALRTLYEYARCREDHEIRISGLYTEAADVGRFDLVDALDRWEGRAS